MTLHPSGMKGLLSRLLSNYGMVVVLLFLGAFLSVVTWADQHPGDVEGARNLFDRIAAGKPDGASVLIVARASEEDVRFADELERLLRERKFVVAGVVKGQPSDAREMLDGLSSAGKKLDVIAVNSVTGRWGLFDGFDRKFPGLAGAEVQAPQSYRWPNFLKADNLMNVANQIAVIAILAVGMTLVIVTGGIDLSVGSLIALSAVLIAWIVRETGGEENAGTLGILLGGMVAVLLCAAAGAFSGSMVTFFGVPPFIATLAMMLMASGFSYIVARGQSISDVPESFVWLGHGKDLLGLPNAVLLMLLLYAASHVLMSRTALGRYIYSVGGNAEAARLSGVPVRRVLLFVYTGCGALAGLGGVVMASQLGSGAPTYGIMYELYVIAAVVVGGTSLSGGKGTIFGTLIGAFIIGVIQNGMNLTGVEAYTQKVVLGAVILGAVLLEKIKRRGGGA